MKHGSLFSGIGGFDLAAEWMGWQNVFHCEWNKFGQKVLKHYWPNAISYEDITKTDFTIHRGQIDVFTGGFPCQPYSQAGKRLGKEDDRHLWPEMLRAIREIQPKWVVGENVLGIVNWNGGLVFDEVQVDLESEGYEVQAYVLPAAGVNAPHQRYRVWFIAHSNKRNDGRNTAKDEAKSKEERISERNEIRQSIESGEVQRTTSHTESNGNTPQRESAEVKGGRRTNDGKPKKWSEQAKRSTRLSGFLRPTSDSEGKRHESSSDSREGMDAQKKSDVYGRECNARAKSWSDFPTQSPVCSGDDGLSGGLDGITFPKWRNESIKAYGNAVVPQVVYQIFKAIEQYENGDQKI